MSSQYLQANYGNCGPLETPAQITKDLERRAELIAATWEQQKKKAAIDLASAAKVHLQDLETLQMSANVIQGVSGKQFKQKNTKIVTDLRRM